MRTHEFHRRIHLLIGDDNLADGELNYSVWLTIKRGIYRLLEEAGSESRCAHKEPLYQGIICEICGRKPNSYNTLERE